MIEIRQDNCVIQIYDDAHLSEMSVPKFRKLLKMAATHSNDPEKIREQIIETLISEKRLRESQIHGDRDYYSDSGIKYFRSRLKKIEKLRGIVDAWDI